MTHLPTNGGMMMNELKGIPIPPKKIRIYADGRTLALNKTMSLRLVARMATEGLIKRRRFDHLPLSVRKRHNLLQIYGPDAEGNAVMLKNHIIVLRDRELANQLTNHCRYDCEVISETVGPLGMSIVVDLSTKKELIISFKKLNFV